MISIIIPVYKNYDMFLSNLKINRKYLEGCEVIIMNDYPDHKITDEVKKNYTKSIVVDNQINLGFGSNVNKGAKLAKGEYLFLMNSDVILNDDSFKKSVEEFEMDKELFALSFAQIGADGKFVGSNKGYFKDGLIYHDQQVIKDKRKTAVNLWAEGGSSIVKKNLFLELGGFDSLYNPFYWEDIDLSYRAWKMGFKVIYYPEVKVRHYHETTIGKYFTKQEITKIAVRNQIIFNWKNLTDSDLIIKHLIYLPILMLRAIIDGNWLFLWGFFAALTKLPRLLRSRSKAVKLFIKADKEILEQFS